MERVGAVRGGTGRRVGFCQRYHIEKDTYVFKEGNTL